MASISYSSSNRSKSQSSGRGRTPTPTPTEPSDSSLYFNSEGVKVRILSKQMGATVCQLDDNFVQKSGERVKPCEAAAMRLVGEGANVPLPEYIDENYDRENGYMLMTYIPGSTLEVLWGKLNDDTKGRLCRDTWDIIAQIRKIHRPPEYQHFFQCSADGSATHNPLIEDLKKPPRPILNDTVLREWIYERYL